MATNPFAQFGYENSAPQVIEGPPRQPAPQTPAQANGDRLANELAELRIQEARREQQEAQDRAARNQQQLGSARGEIRAVIDAARRAQQRSREGWFQTGFGSDWIGGNTPEGRALRGDLDVIGSNTAFNRLQQMRAESPTGGALGSITERELALLQSTVASLDPGQTDADFQRNMDTIIQRYQGILDRLPQDQADGQPSDAAQREEVPGVTVVPASEDTPEHYSVDPYRGPPAQGSGIATPGLGDQLVDSTINTVAGLGQGVAALPDALAQGTAAFLSLPADWLGADFIADNLRRPITIGGEIERVAPTPQDWTGWGIRTAGQLTGGVAGFPQRAQSAVLNAALGRQPVMPPGYRSTSATPPSLANDAEALDMTMMPADAGGAITRMMTGAFAQTPGGVLPITRGANRALASGERALQRIAGRAGSPQNAERAGETATRGALRYRDRSRLEASRLYDDAARLSEGVNVTPTNAMTALDQHIAELGENPAGTEGLQFLTSLRERLAQAGGVSVAGIRGMRTQLRDRFLSAGLRGSDLERRVNEVVQAASDDVTQSLINAGRSEAADTYRMADQAWRQRAETLDEVIMPIIGRRGERSGEEVFRALQRAGQGNGARLRQFVNSLPEDEAGAVRASMINALGRPSAGRQNAAGDAFSLSEFLTHWNNLGDTARRALFDADSSRDIERLARMAEASKAASAYANTSRTGAAVTTGAMGMGAMTPGGFPVVAAALAAQVGAGLLLSSPRVANILARATSVRSPQQAQGVVRELSEAASRNPALANEIGDLQRRLTEAFSGSPAFAAAAQEQEDVRQEVPNQQ